MLSGVDLEGGGLRLPADLHRRSSRGRSTTSATLILALAVDRARLRIADRVPRAGRPRRDRVLEPRADGPDHDRPLRGERRRASTAPCCRSVNHGLVSATLFLLAGAIERRTARATSRGSAGWPAAGRRSRRADDDGVIALAVPGSSSFAGEFLILAGVFSTGWGWAVVGAIGNRARGDVHAAADLGCPAPASRLRGPDAALDLRPAELGIVVPLVALPARALGLAGGDQRTARARPTLTTAPSTSWRSSSTAARRASDRRRPTSTGSRSRLAGHCSAPRRSACSRRCSSPVAPPALRGLLLRARVRRRDRRRLARLLEEPRRAPDRRRRASAATGSPPSRS